jgi:small subunit ribosomal protein S17
MTTDEKPQTPAARPSSPKSGPRKDARVGQVDSISGKKTIRVVLGSLVKHPLYGKYLRRRTKLLVHDENQQAQVGDTVQIEHCRPLSASKAWRLVRIVRKTAGAEAQA